MHPHFSTRLFCVASLAVASACSSGGKGSSSASSSATGTTSTNATAAAGSASSTTAAAGSSGTTGSATSTVGTTGASSTTASSSTGSAGTSGSSGSSGTTSTTEAQFCSSVVSELCTLGEACGEFDTNCSAVLPVAGLGGVCSPGMSFDATQASQCLTALQSAVTATNCSPLDAGSCGLVFGPGTAEGASCTSFGACINRPDGGTVYCDTGSSACPGVCSAGRVVGQACQVFGSLPPCLNSYCNQTTQVCTSYIAAGADCTSEPGGCDPSVDTCAGSGSTSTCTAFIAPGADCTSDPQLCEPGTTCTSPSDGGSAQTCQYFPLLGQGDAGLGQGCTASSSFGGSNCDQGLACLSGTCVSSSPGIGEPCDSVSVFCSGSEYCGNPDGGAGLCVANPGLGQPCGPFGACSTGFVAPLVCVSGTCRALPGPGAPCFDGGAFAFNTCLAGDYCNTQGSCQAIAAQGGSCDPGVIGTSACVDGYCSAGTCVPLLPAGSACDPTLFQCSLSGLNSSGVDLKCISADGGATFCESCP